MSKEYSPNLVVRCIVCRIESDLTDCEALTGDQVRDLLPIEDQEDWSFWDDAVFAVCEGCASLSL